MIRTSPRFYDNACWTGIAIVVLCLNAVPVRAASNTQPSDALEQPPAQTDTESVPEAVTEAAMDPERLEAIRMGLLRQETLLQAVASMESQSRGYNLELHTTLLELAHVQQDLELYAEAEQTLANALQLLRTEHGLNDPRQLPVLQLQFEVNKANANWEAADASVNLMELVSRKSYPPGDQVRITALSRHAGWLIKASAEELVSGHQTGLKQLLRRYELEIAQLQQLDTNPDRGYQLAILNLDLAAINYQLARITGNNRLSDYQSNERATITTTQCQMVRLANGIFTQQCYTREIGNPDYYVDQSNQLNSELREYMRSMKEAIDNAFASLGEEAAYTGRETALLAEMATLTRAYNAFVTQRAL